MGLVSISFVEEQQTIHVEAGLSLSDICDAHSSSLLFGCREASCGTCLMEVLEGQENLSDITEEERELLAILAPSNSNARLACQCTVWGDVLIRSL